MYTHTYIYVCIYKFICAPIYTYHLKYTTVAATACSASTPMAVIKYEELPRYGLFARSSNTK